MSTRTSYQVQVQSRSGWWLAADGRNVEVTERDVREDGWDGRRAGCFNSDSRTVQDVKDYLLNVIPPYRRDRYRIVEIVSTMTVIEL